MRLEVVSGICVGPSSSMMSISCSVSVNLGWSWAVLLCGILYLSCISNPSNSLSSSRCISRVRLFMSVKASNDGEGVSFDIGRKGKFFAFSRMCSKTVFSVIILQSSSSVSATGLSTKNWEKTSRGSELQEDWTYMTWEAIAIYHLRNLRL